MPTAPKPPPVLQTRALLTDPALCLQAVVANGLDLRLVDASLKTEALCRMACQHHGGALAYVPAHLKTRELCLLAARHGTSLHCVPEALWDTELIAMLVRHNGHAFSSLPPCWQTDSTVAAALNAGQIDGVELHLQTPGAALLAIVEDFSACAKVPGYLFTQAVFDKAETLYHQHPQWPALVVQRKPHVQIGDTRPTLSSDTFKAIWACYLNEDLCIAALHAGDALYRLPRHLLTRRVCDAAFEWDRFNFTWIPPSYMTQAMCARAVQTDYGQLLNLVPEHLMTPALCLSAVEANQDALACVPEALRTLPLYTAAVNAYSRTLDQVPQALRREVLTQLIAQDPSNAPYYFSKRAEEAAAQQDFVQAVADCDEVLRHRPQLAQAYFQRANALHALGQWAQAYQDVQTALALDDKLPWANNLTGMLVECAGTADDLPTAIAAYGREIKRQPDALKPRLNRAELYLKQGDGARANADLEQALHLEPDNPWALYLRGYLGYEAGDMDASLADFNAALQTKTPRHPPAEASPSCQPYAAFTPAATSCSATDPAMLGAPRNAAQWEAAIRERPILITRLPTALRSPAMAALAAELDATLAALVPQTLEAPQPKAVAPHPSWPEQEQTRDKPRRTGKGLRFWGQVYEIVEVFAKSRWQRKKH